MKWNYKLCMLAVAASAGAGVLAVETLSPAALAAAEAAPAATAAPGVQHIVRVSMISLDVPKMRRFYVDGLGFNVVREGIVAEPMSTTIATGWNLPRGTKIYSVTLSTPDGKAALGLTGAVGRRVPVLNRSTTHPFRAGQHYLILRAPNVDALAAKMKAMGVPFWRERMPSPSGAEFGVLDPDGTRVIVEGPAT